MLKRLKGAAVGCAVILVTSAIAYASGLFPGLPIVGGASYCQGTSVYSQSITVPGTLATPNNCTVSVPAGPSIVTGNELIPADTQAANGVAPQSVYLSLASLNALPPAYSLFSNATSVNAFTVSPLVGKVVILGNAALSNTSVQMPASPVDGQELQISSNQTIATFNISANTGQTVESSTKPTVITISTTAAFGYAWLWRAADSTWHRIQ